MSRFVHKSTENRQQLKPRFVVTAECDEIIVTDAGGPGRDLESKGTGKQEQIQKHLERNDV
jgi:hypothetical protein